MGPQMRTLDDLIEKIEDNGEFTKKEAAKIERIYNKYCSKEC